MNILFAINEVAPLYKLGGLGDVGGSLPKALATKNLDVRIVMPYHPDIKLLGDSILQTEFIVSYAHQRVTIKVYLSTLPHSSIPVYLIDEPDYIRTYSHTGDQYGDKYAIFSLAVTTFIEAYSPYWQPQIIHCHDWHTALIPVLLKHTSKGGSKPQTILTIHNLAYQGSTKTPIAKRLELNSTTCQIAAWDSNDSEMNILMEGILHADMITTVSLTYAKEILTPEYGCHLESILQTRKNNLYGIINGLDEYLFNPQTDPEIAHRFSVTNAVENKRLNKSELLKELNLNNNNLPLLIFIGRIDPYQKGLDLVLEYLYKQNTLSPHNFIFLGTGDPQYEQRLHQANQNPTHISIHTRYDETLAHKMYAAADIIFIPSNFEPCGLIQLIGMRYGVIPVAHKTGGLYDTIVNQKTGFTYAPNTFNQAYPSLETALKIINNPETHVKFIENCMNQDFSWDKSAQMYEKLYTQMIKKRDS